MAATMGTSSRTRRRTGKQSPRWARPAGTKEKATAERIDAIAEERPAIIEMATTAIEASIRTSGTAAADFDLHRMESGIIIRSSATMPAAYQRAKAASEESRRTG